jgi:hypothetical protein
MSRLTIIIKLEDDDQQVLATAGRFSLCPLHVEEDCPDGRIGRVLSDLLAKHVLFKVDNVLTSGEVVAGPPTRIVPAQIETTIEFAPFDVVEALRKKLDHLHLHPVREMPNE